MKSNLSVGLVTAAEYTPCFAWSIHPHRAYSHVALEAILARGVDVARHRAFAVSPEAHPVIEPVRVLEAGVRPQHQPCEGVGAAPTRGHGCTITARPSSTSAMPIRRSPPKRSPNTSDEA